MLSVIERSFALHDPKDHCLGMYYIRSGVYSILNNNGNLPYVGFDYRLSYNLLVKPVLAV
jgi:hypothetical protein